MLIDSHCHLDAAEFSVDRDAVVRDAEVALMIVPAVQERNFETVRALAHAHTGIAYALGIHPMYVAKAQESDLERLESLVATQLSDPRLVAIGEIGLDFFIPELSVGHLRTKQEHFYLAQLKIARKFDLPVILHVRRSQDVLLKYLRRIPVSGGIAHAFNGSQQQADAFVNLGFALGFGGAMTYPRALQIRRLARSLPESAIVLETDAPDIPPEWLHREFLSLDPTLRAEHQQVLRNTPSQLARIANCLAQLRETSLDHVADFTTANVLRVLPHVAATLSAGPLSRSFG